MAETTNDTIIVVGVTELDEYNNLWVTPQGGGDKIKIGAKREHLHPLFEQGRAILLHWETYKGKTYVADAKLVEGELPPAPEPHPDEPIIKPPYKPPQQYRGRDEDKVDIRTAIMEIGADYRAGKIGNEDSLVFSRRVWLEGIAGVTEITKREPIPKEPDKSISVGDIKTVIYQNNWKETDALEYAKMKWGVNLPKELTQEQRKELIDHIKANPRKGG